MRSAKPAEKDANEDDDDWDMGSFPCAPATGAAAGAASAPQITSALELPAGYKNQLACSSEEIPVSKLVVSSVYENMKASEKVAAIVTKFNARVKESIITDPGARSGERIEPGMFLLAHRNKIPEIYAGTGARRTLKITTGYTDTGYLGSPDGKCKQTEPLIGDYGSYIVNVQQGMLARVWSSNEPKLLGEGTHVIHDELFRREPDGRFFVKRSEQHIEHGTIHILRVPLGSLGKVLIDSKPVLLPYRAEPYGFYTPFLQFAGFVKQSEPYIDFGTLHLLRVPAGSVAKCWLGSKPMVLEYREEPYFFDDPLFRVEKPRTGTDALFESANVKHIQHGSINRLRPGVNGELEVAVVQHDGELHFVDRFVTIDDPSQAVLGFLDIGLQTHVFPSRTTREERRRENPRATIEEISFEPMTTRDSLKVGLKLLVAFQCLDPHRLMSKLRLKDIIGHVENLAVSDMARAVQNSTSQNFLHSSNRHKDEMTESDMSITDRVRLELAHHLDDCGLKLIRFNIEEAKVLDEELAKEMAKQALVAATASAQQAVIEQKAAVARSNAELEAMARRVKQDQENSIRISAAQAELEAERIKAQGVLVQAAAERDAALMRGQQLRDYPELLQLEIVRLQMQALRSCTIVMCAPEIAQTPFVNLQQMLATSVQGATAQAAAKKAARPADDDSNPK
jgi:regulator of protease activity HflC (stomatin/prohibitin superfamily)